MKRFFVQIWNILYKNNGEQAISPEKKSILRKMDEILHDEEPDFDRIWQNIKYRTVRPARNTKIVTICLKVAAVAIPVAILSTFLLNNDKQISKQVVSIKHKEIQKENPLAVKLTLSDGSTVDLSKNSNDLVKSGNTSIQQASSRSLAYTATNKIQDKVEYNTVETGTGATYQLKLSDGTVVYLNSKSKLRYPIAFIGKERLVHLEGEGYFEIKSNKSRPFRVNVGGVVVTAVGTQFNINSYSARKGIKTTLVEGQVLVNNGNQEITLLPGQQATNLNGKTNIKHVDCEEFTSWRFGRYVFRSVPLEDILNQLELWYDITIVVENESLKNINFTGMIDKRMPVEETLMTIEKTGEISCEIKGKQVTIK